MRATTLTIKRAKALRRTLSVPEMILWREIKGRRLDGHQFRKQHPVGHYILDFYCSALRLAVEVDGSSHERPERIGHDERRDAWLRSQGIEMLRLSAKELIEDPDVALTSILGAARALAPSTASRSPSPAGAVEE